jgi:hypothetical protein
VRAVDARARTLLAAGWLLTAGMITGCSADPVTLPSPTTPAMTLVAATRLPLQPTVPPVDGDAQPPVGDPVRARVTDSDVRRLAEKCARQAAVTNTATDCYRQLSALATRGDTCHADDLCLVIARTKPTGSNVAGSGSNQSDSFVAQVVDNRPGQPLCGAESNGVCLQLPVTGKAGTSLDQTAGVGDASPGATAPTDVSASQPTASTSPSVSPSSSPASAQPSADSSGSPGSSASSSSSVGSTIDAGTAGGGEPSSNGGSEGAGAPPAPGPGSNPTQPPTPAAPAATPQPAPGTVAQPSQEPPS